MKKIILLISLLAVLGACHSNESSHVEPTHNFTVKRLIILNEKGEVLMGKEAGNWYTPSIIYDKRQYIKESLDSLSSAFGIRTTTPKLRGYFSYKYEYHPYATLRAYYVAEYLDGELHPSGEMTEMKWFSAADAIAQTPVESMKIGMQQMLQHPDTLWGASFMVYRDGEHHHARLVEDFYPLFD